MASRELSPKHSKVTVKAQRMKHSLALILCCLALPQLAARGQSDPSPSPTPVPLYDVVVYGRMEPVFMVLSQSAPIAAGLALDSSVSVQEVPYPALREKLEAAKQIVDVSQVPEQKPTAGPKRFTP
jgi:hypothetical protein